LKKLFAFLTILCIGVLSVSAQDQYWLLLEKGKNLFRDKLYGDALLYFEDAVRARKDLFAKSYESLIAALSFSEVRSKADDLAAVERVLEEKKLEEAEKILAVLYKLVPRDSFGNSVKAVLNKIKALQAYPEGEYWIGEVFRVEGETTIALAQYQKALTNKALFEIPDDARQLLYRMADLQSLRREYAGMEESLSRILADDELWSDPSRDFTRTAMERTLLNDGLDRFLTLYRHHAPFAYRAHRDLGIYYYRTGRHDRASRHLMFAFLIASTIILDELRYNDIEFLFSTFSESLSAAQKNEATKAYMISNEFSMTMYYFAAAQYANGQRKAANELWRGIPESLDNGEWRSRALRQLKSPFVEPTTPVP